MKVALIVPTLKNAGHIWKELLDALGQQTLRGDIELVIDSDSTDDTVKLAEAAGIVVHGISRKDFNHGATRQLGVHLAPDGGASGLVQSTLGVGTPVSSYDPALSVNMGIEHLTLPQSSEVLYGVPSLQLNTAQVNALYTQAFSSGTSISFEFNNNRQTTNSRRYSSVTGVEFLLPLYVSAAVAGGIWVRAEFALSADREEQQEDFGYRL